MESTKEMLHIAIVPSPGMGHLIPLAELAKQLVVRHNFHVTFIIPTNSSSSSLTPQNPLLKHLPKPISSIFLPPVSFDDLPGDSGIEARIALSVTRSLSFLRESLLDLTRTNRVVALVVDIFGTDAFDMARELDISPHLFFTTSAMCICFGLYLPKLHEKYSCEYRDLPEPVKLPGCAPLHGADLLDAVQDRKNLSYEFTLHHSKRFRLPDGILVNSFLDLENDAFKALKKEILGIPPIYPVGPLIQSTSVDGPHGSDFLRWLDQQQPGESVLFVSFGSGGTLSNEQINELAHGLELSGERFIWVVKRPRNKTANEAYFAVQSGVTPLDFLPSGFLGRTKEVGFVVPDWAPQIQILSHESTAGFVTHCGWNSILESIVYGVPLIAWPLYAEQKMNAVFLTEDAKVALRVGLDENGIVGRDYIAKLIKQLVKGEEGKLLRRKMSNLKEAAAKVLSDGGTSTQSLFEVASIWSNNKKEESCYSTKEGRR